jgi:endonuclease IV/L-amino acid N-acyltransferase YncA
LKLWSSNKNYIQEAQRLYDNGIYQYIELFAVPGTFDDVIGLWKELKIPFIIHAPHFREGLNFARPECLGKNKKLAQEALKFADALDAQQVIFHPGVDGDIKETARQLKQLFDSRMVIENKPYCSDDGKLVCNGFSPDEIAFLIAETGIGFCLDIAHAICAANALKKEPIGFIKSFLNLNPKLFHVSDNDWESVKDAHKHLGHGSFKFKEIIQLLPPGSKITLETPHDYSDSLRDFEQDVRTLQAHSNPQEFYFSEANASDAHDVYALANDLAVRRNSLIQDEISWDTHVAWFNEKLKNKRSLFYVIRDKSHALVGQVRFDEIVGDAGKYLTSFSLAKDFRGRGLGAKLLIESIKKLSIDAQFDSLIAYVKKENEASLKCFLKAGFNLIGEEYLHGCQVYKMQFTSGGQL